ncbi:hypothetical protein CLF_112554 [Clonorchis sinensis]|uniref:C-type lectin domain-containing protein n=1 Tax=Clonorchis sinensis TaxID=79923 RepID=G7YWL0_CLOSI|nr:hypothetical protein CLF_112554 [Clonorchis sinensis]
MSNILSLLLPSALLITVTSACPDSFTSVGDGYCMIEYPGAYDYCGAHEFCHDYGRRLGHRLFMVGKHSRKLAEYFDNTKGAFTGLHTLLNNVGRSVDGWQVTDPGNTPPTEQSDGLIWEFVRPNYGSETIAELTMYGLNEINQVNTFRRVVCELSTVPLPNEKHVEIFQHSVPPNGIFLSTNKSVGCFEAHHRLSIFGCALWRNEMATSCLYRVHQVYCHKMTPNRKVYVERQQKTTSHNNLGLRPEGASRHGTTSHTTVGIDVSGYGNVKVMESPAFSTVVAAVTLPFRQEQCTKKGRHSGFTYITGIIAPLNVNSKFWVSSQALGKYVLTHLFDFWLQELLSDAELCENLRIHGERSEVRQNGLRQLEDIGLPNGNQSDCVYGECFKSDHKAASNLH